MINLTSKNREIKGVSINYITGGKGPVLVLFPGFPSGFYPDDSFLNFISKKFTIVAVNIPGFGISEAIEGKTGFDEMAEIVNILLKELKVPKFSVSGFSFGGGLALTMAEMYPNKVSKVCVVSPLLGYRFLVRRVRIIFDGIELFYGAFPKISEKIILGALNTWVADRLYKLVSDYDIEVDEGKRNKEVDLKNLKRMSLKSCMPVFCSLKNTDLSRVNIPCPLLVIYSGNDSFVGTSPGLLSNISSYVKTINDSGEHWNLMNGKNREEIAKFLLYSKK